MLQKIRYRGERRWAYIAEDCPPLPARNSSIRWRSSTWGCTMSSVSGCLLNGSLLSFRRCCTIVDLVMIFFNGFFEKRGERGGGERGGAKRVKSHISSTTGLILILILYNTEFTVAAMYWGITSKRASRVAATTDHMPYDYFVLFYRIPLCLRRL